MRKLTLGLAALVSLSVVGAAQAQGADGPRLKMLIYPPAPEHVACAEGESSLLRGDTIDPNWSFAAAPLASGAPVDASTMIDESFDIDASGRPHNLQSVPPSLFFMATLPSDQLGAVIAATWRFAPGHTYTACKVHVAAQYTPISEISRATAFAALANRPNIAQAGGAYGFPDTAGPMRNIPTAVPTLRADLADFDTLNALIHPVGGDCGEGALQHPRLVAFPDWDAVKDDPGARSWVVVSFDVGDDGHVNAAKVEASSGNASLDAQGLAAAGQSLFGRKAHKGCLAVFRHQGPPVPWPTEPPVTTSASCPVDPKLQVGDVSRRFPQAYQQRSVEGWALVRYDVAPWGAVGDVIVVRAEPAAAFGDAARMIVEAGTPSTKGQSATGCLLPIRFKMPPTQ